MFYAKLDTVLDEFAPKANVLGKVCVRKV